MVGQQRDRTTTLARSSSTAVSGTLYVYDSAASTTVAERRRVEVVFAAGIDSAGIVLERRASSTIPGDRAQ